MSKIAAIPLVLALLGGYGLASAQEKADEKTKRELKQVEPLPPATGRSQPEQAGTQEPGTKGKGPASSQPVFVNGALAVPGAATDGHTVPSKFSTRNAEIDGLPTAAFRLHRLTDAQKREIYEQLQGGTGGPALSPAHAIVGAQIPSRIALHDLTPTPERLTAEFPELQETSYLVQGAMVLLVDTDNSMVIGVLSAP